jgi:hypothetical protein
MINVQDSKDPANPEKEWGNNDNAYTSKKNKLLPPSFTSTGKEDVSQKSNEG